MRFRRHAVVAASCFWLSVLPAAAQWAQCASDLVELREVARAVQESADRVASIETAVRSGEEAYARCVEDRQNFNADPQTNPFPGAIQGRARPA